MSDTLPPKIAGPVPEKYRDWIDKNYPKNKAVASCQSATLSMVLEFPELKRVRGYHYGEHWWCETQDGEIVDPTTSQFADQPPGEYHLLDESKPQPTGYCGWCKAPVFNHRKYCEPYDGAKTSECEDLRESDIQREVEEINEMLASHLLR